jgi:hypothetical protein
MQEIGQSFFNANFGANVISVRDLMQLILTLNYDGKFNTKIKD